MKQFLANRYADVIDNLTFFSVLDCGRFFVNSANPRSSGYVEPNALIDIFHCAGNFLEDIMRSLIVLKLKLPNGRELEKQVNPVAIKLVKAYLAKLKCRVANGMPTTVSVINGYRMNDSNFSKNRFDTYAFSADPALKYQAKAVFVFIKLLVDIVALVQDEKLAFEIKRKMIPLKIEYVRKYYSFGSVYEETWNRLIDFLARETSPNTPLHRINFELIEGVYDEIQTEINAEVKTFIERLDYYAKKDFDFTSGYGTGKFETIEIFCVSEYFV